MSSACAVKCYATAPEERITMQLILEKLEWWVIPTLDSEAWTRRSVCRVHRIGPKNTLRATYHSASNCSPGTNLTIITHYDFHL